MSDFDPERPLELPTAQVPANCVCKLLNTHSRVPMWEVEVIAMKFPFKGQKRTYQEFGVTEQQAAATAMKRFSREMCFPGLWR